MLSRLELKLASFILKLDVESYWEIEEFAMMIEMGFFVLTGQRYQMTIPTGLSIDTVRRAALKYALTEDEDYLLHPEYLIITMPFDQAEAWQERLRVMDSQRRCADRLLLLDSGSNRLADRSG